MSGLFISGAGTGVGKTFVTTILCRQLGRQGRPVRALKPVISGFSVETAAQSDTGLLLAAQGLGGSEETIETVSPWRFAAALSPDMAARREGRKIDFEALLAYCRREMAIRQRTLLIEGVGGVMVPLDDRHLVVDWMAALGLPALLVTGSYLGSLSHALTAAQALRSRGIALAAVVVSESPDSPVPLAESAGCLGRFLEGVPVLTVGRLSDWTQAPDLTGIIPAS